MLPIRRRTFAAVFCVLFASAAVATDFGRTPGEFGVSSGSANYTVPIWTPPGPNGVQPSIALTYNSQSGNGIGGVGWNISGLGSIYRCPRTPHQDSNAQAIDLTINDRFCINGNRLRLASGTYGAANSVYYTELADYSRITAFGSAGNGPAYFVVEARSGLKYEFGNTGGSRVVLGTTAVQWMLDKVYDRSGNNYTVTYSVATGNAVPASIYWTPTSLGASTYRYEMEFMYFTTRPNIDSTTGEVAGNIVTNTNRIESIRVKSAGTVVRKYRFAYGTSTVTSRSLLTSAKECADDAETNCFQPTTFTYQTGQAGLTAGAGTPPAGSSNSIYRGHYDFNGDGKNDIAYLNGTTWYVALSTNSGFSSAYSTGVTSTDIAIDQFLPTGRAAIAVIVSGNLWIYRWDDATSAFVGNNTGIATSLGVALDYNGDRLTDFVYLGTAGTLRVRPNTSTGSGNPTFASSTTTTAQLPTDWSYTLIDSYLNKGLYHADVNGDGRGDLYAEVVFTDRSNPDNTVVNSIILTGLGSGLGLPPMNTWGPEGANWNLVNFNDDACTDRISGLTIEIAACNGGYASTITLPALPSQFLDWDGDGRTDVLVDNGGTFGVYKSQGSTFGPLITTSLPSSGTFFDTDLDGDGLDDLVKVNGTAAISYWTHTATGAAPTYATNIPDLLSSVTDGFGVTNSVSYVSTAWSQYDKGATTSYPLQEAPPQIVVAKSTNADGIGGTFDKSYFYVGARLHAQRRRSVGFQRLDETDSRNSLVGRLYFEQSFPLTGMLLQRELMQPNGTTTIGRTVAVNTSTTLDATANNQRWFAYTSGSTSYQYEVGSSWNGVLLRTETASNLYDTTSGVLYDQTITIAEPSGANGVNAGGSWVSRTYLPLANLLNDTTNWCLGRPQQVQSINSSNLTYGALTTRTTNLSWNASLCRPTQSVDEPGNGTLQVTTDIGYDSFGNVNSRTVTGVGVDSRSSSVTYADSTYTTGQFPIGITQKVSSTFNQTSTMMWDYDRAVPLSATDANGLTTTWHYDGFGRRDTETRPDGTSSGLAYSDCAVSGYCPGNIKTAETASDYDNAGAVVERVSRYRDRFGRVVQQFQRSRDWISTNTNTEYDSLGHVSRTSAPCFASGSGCATQYWTTNTYDLIGRITDVSQPISDSIPALQLTTIYYEGLTTRVKDPLDKYSYSTINSAGQLARSQDHDGNYQNFDYDAFGNPKRVTDSAGNTLQSSSYNLRGMLTDRSDMDLGSWVYDPNALGDLAHIRDGKTSAPAWTQTLTYDGLGRMTSRTESEGTSTWTWGVSSGLKNIGSLASVSGPGYSETYSYDALARLSSINISADTSYQFDFTYNSMSAVDTLTYPTSTSSYRLKLQYEYFHGQLHSIKDYNAPSTVFWTANAGNPRDQIVQETLGTGVNSVVSSRVFDLSNGRLKTIQSGAGGGAGIQNLSYTWDVAGNLATRDDINQSNLTETFSYDNLYRLIGSTLNTGSSMTYAYDALGNITSKSDVGSYTYHTTKKHQVVSTSNGWSFGYDANGNMTSGRGTSLDWTSYNYPSCIRLGADCSGTSTDYSAFSYTPARQYWKQIANYAATGTATTIYVGGLLEKVTTSAGTDYRHQIRAGNSTIIVSRQSSGTNSVYYVTSDHLGSSAAITDSSGGILVNESFDSFGKRRGSNWSGGPSGGDWTAIAGTTRRGFTEHTMLDNLNLTHMNGRLYDPLLGRFASADPFISDPLNTQNFNRYSYVYNNPLSMVDPSGFEACQSGDSGYFVGTTFAHWYCGKDWSPPGYPAGPLPPDRGGPSENGGTESDGGSWGIGSSVSSWSGIGLTDRGQGNRSGAQQLKDFMCSIGIASCTEVIPELAPDPYPGVFEGGGIFRYCYSRSDCVIIGERPLQEVDKEAFYFYFGGALARGIKAPMAARGTTTVIGRTTDLGNLAKGERSLLDRLTPDLGSPKANWARNSGVLREEMKRGLPIRDASVGDTGGAFLNAERALLRERGWTFHSPSGMWMPPGT